MVVATRSTMRSLRARACISVPLRGHAAPLPPPTAPNPSSSPSPSSRRCVENITSYYVAALGAYRALYILNWIYRFTHEAHYSAWIAWISGAVQTIFYVDFFYYFLKAKAQGRSKHVVLPG